MSDEKIIMFDSDEAATYKTNIEGWVSKGRFWGKDERMARYYGSTHNTCECGGIVKKNWTKCDKCREKSSEEKYLSYRFKTWDGETPFYCTNNDKYFFDHDSYTDFMEEEELSHEDFRIVLCKPNSLHNIELDYWEDVMPEDDWESYLPDGFEEKLKELNEIINKSKPITWCPDNIRTDVSNPSVPNKE